MLIDNSLFGSFIKEIDESYFNNNEAKFIFLQFYECYEDGEKFDLNKTLLRKNDEAFSNFFIDYVSKKDLHFGANFDAIPSEVIGEKEKEITKFNDKLSIAYEDNLIEIKVRKIDHYLFWLSY